jgi:hypothetical protein
MAATGYFRPAAAMDVARRILPQSADIRDVGSWQLLDVRYWADDTPSLLGEEEERVLRDLGLWANTTRGWVVPSGSVGYSDHAHFFAGHTVLFKKRAADGTLFYTAINDPDLRPLPAYVLRFGTVFSAPLSSDTRWVHEELILNVVKSDFSDTYADYVLDEIRGLPPSTNKPDTMNANFEAFGNPIVRAAATYSIPAPLYAVTDPPAAPVRPGDQPILYSVMHASGPWKEATNMLLSYDPSTTERELAVLRATTGV